MAEVPSPQTPLRAIGGFELIEKIGQGAMGAVFKAHQRSLDRVVALKVLPPSIAKDAQFIERFQREARASARFTHPNIVMGIDVGQDRSNGLWYFAMEYVDGPSVRQVLKQQGVLPERRALEIARDIARALECAASHQIVHRDVKPDNILLTSDGKAKLADLGLARRISGEDAALTQDGQAVGTPLYMAPEQIRGQLDQIDIRTDLYSLGCTLFHLVTGEPPFDGPTNAVVMSKHLAEKPPLAHRVNAKVSEACGRLIARLMQKNREQRVQTPSDLLADIERLLSPTATRRNLPTRATTGPRRAVRPSAATPPEQPKQNRKATVVIFSVLVLAGGGFIAAILLSRGRQPEVQTALKDEPVDAPLRPSPTPPAPQPAVRPPVTPPPPEPDVAVEPTDPVPGTEPTEPGPADKDRPPPEEASGVTKDEPPPTEPPPAVTIGEGDKKEKASASFVGRMSLVGNSEKPAQAFADQPTLDFNWPKGAPEGLSLGTGVYGGFSGAIRPAQTGAHVFELTTTMSCRLYVDEVMMLDQWGTNGTTRTPPVHLDRERKYSVRVELYSRRPEATASVRWGVPDAPLTPVRALSEEEGLDVPAGHIAGGWNGTYSTGDATEKTVTRRDWTVAFDWGAASPGPGIPKDQFRARWHGVIIAPKTGDYVFHLDVDEGGRVFVGDLLILDSRNGPRGRSTAPPVRLEEGKRYAVSIDFHERLYDAKCRLTWSTPDGKEEPVPAMGEGADNLTELHVGFLADHWQAGEQVLKRREVQAGWLWGAGSPDHGLHPDSFAVTYSGWISPSADGTYTFAVEHQGSIRFFVDDVLLVSNVNRRAKLEGGSPDETTVPLEGGKHYFLRVVYHGRTYDDRLRVTWRAEGVPEQLVQGVPPETRRAADPGTGRVETALLAEYGTGGQPAMKQLEGRVSHDFGSGSPGGDVPNDGFWARWRGGLIVPETGKYQLRVSCDNYSHAEAKINRVRILRTEKEGKGDSEILPLQKGVTYFLEVFYQHRNYASNVHLLWRGPGRPEFEVIPAEAFVLAPADKKTPRRVP